eukprot:TRINITY_DN5472_c0_g1_i1.p2 TRINITY_DN5472_c0_g1~~TRINITY_DN5472_c0_g1_i1.p2  ORF type:complete len:113 (-),score=14.42 TRINITY_DN5472_c0_g1_i1:1071-1409(-)
MASPTSSATRVSASLMKDSAGATTNLSTSSSSLAIRPASAVSLPDLSRKVPAFLLMKLTNDSMSLGPSYFSPALLSLGNHLMVGKPVTSKREARSLWASASRLAITTLGSFS